MLALTIMDDFRVVMRHMLKRAKLLLANLLWMTLCLKRAYCFYAAVFNVQDVQKKVLLRILRKNRDTSFGKAHEFTSIAEVADFQARVQTRTYDDYKEYIDSISRGEEKVLTSESIMLFEPSSGSTSSSKYIPYTPGLYEEFRNGLSPWIFDLFAKRRRLLLGSSYWSISPITKKSMLDSKVPVGFGNDANYFGKIERDLLNAVFAVPSIVSEIEDVEAFRYVTLRFLLCERQLAFISIWNPSFLILLLEPFEKWSAQLISDIEKGTLTPIGTIPSELKGRLLEECRRDKPRAKELKDILRHRKRREEKGCDDKKTIFEKIWPDLTLISCWAHSHAAAHAQELKMLFPNTEIQPKGLIATEGIVSFPLIGEKGAALSICSHFFEFLEIKDQYRDGGGRSDAKLAHQLEREKLYSVVITTEGGLYRYKLHDIIKVVGYKRQCPLIRFISKESNVSDIAGEKLNELYVATVLSEIFDKYPLRSTFFLLAPERSAKKGVYFYALFLELREDRDSDDYLFSAVAQELEKRLRENYHYAHCINLGQLLPAKLFIINHKSRAMYRYMDTCRRAGQKIGNIKPCALSSRAGWSEFFEGKFVGELNVHNVPVGFRAVL